MTIESWLGDKVQLNNINVGSSDLGGTGLFYDGEVPSCDITVATISRTAIFDYELLMETLNQLKADDAYVAKIVVGFLSNLLPATETEVLMCYFWAFIAAKESRSGGYIEKIQPYLDVLSTTQVDIPIGDAEDKDWFYRILSHQYDQQKEKYEIAILWLESEVADELSWSNKFTFDLFWQIYKAVKSRVLEIPHPVEEDLDDFVTNVTLVPFLDFSNHVAANNAYFDIDRATGNVLLKLDHLKIQSSPVEVCISYSPVEEIQSFISTYGFIPESKGQLQVFNWKLESFDELMNQYNHTKNVPYTKIGKWLQIIPAVQLVLQNDKVMINLSSNPLSILFESHLSYNDNWTQACSNDKLQQICQIQESDYEIIHSPEPWGVLYKNESFDTEIDPVEETLVRHVTKFIQVAAKAHLSSKQTLYHDFRNKILQKAMEGAEVVFMQQIDQMPIVQIEL